MNLHYVNARHVMVILKFSMARLSNGAACVTTRVAFGGLAMCISHGTIPGCVEAFRDNTFKIGHEAKA